MKRGCLSQKTNEKAAHLDVETYTSLRASCPGAGLPTHPAKLLRLNKTAALSRSVLTVVISESNQP